MKFRALIAILLFLGAAPTGLAQDDCHPTQAVFHFPAVMVGLEATGFMDVVNNSGEPLQLEIHIDSPHFSHTQTILYIPAGESRPLRPLFHPQAGGYLEAVMTLGNDLCADVLLTGTGLARSCLAEPGFLDFGVVELGRSDTLTVSVTNDGDVPIPLEAGTLSPVLAVIGPSGDLDPGETFSYDVVFTPDGPGVFTGVVDWGAWYPTCAGVHFTGEGAIDMEPGQNRVGVFFDEDHTELVHLNDGSAEFLTGYLVLTEPAPQSGVAGWELLPGVEGAAYITQWDVRGDFVDAGTGDQMIIGLGAPLPWAQDILLATCTIYVAQSVDELIAVQLKPVWTPSITGRMAWLPAGDEGDLQVMLPFTGVDKVAWIRTGALSPTLEIVPFKATAIEANVPNPFNPSTEIRFSVGRAGPASVRIFDLQGRLVRTLLDGHLTAGPWTRVWDGRDDAGRRAPSGAYYVRLTAVGEAVGRKIMLLK